VLGIFLICEIDLKFLDNSTRRRTELADEPTCCKQAKTGQDGKPNFRFPTNRRQRRNGELAAAFCVTRFEYIERFEPAEPYKPREAIRLDRKSTRRAGRARGNAAS
jgi:hypothetical protein